MEFVCSKCGHREPVNTRKAACDCGGLWKLDFEAPAFDPEKIDHDVWGMFRYHEFMALEGDTWKAVTLGEGMTPCVRFNDKVWLKMDYFMPTLSFKDRGAAVLVAHCKAIGVDKVVQDSSGNAGNSVAAYCGRAGIGCEIYVPEGTSDKKIRMIEAHGSVAHVIPGDRDHCADVCRQRVRDEGIYYANHVYNPFFYEGTKTYIYEVFEQLHRIPSHIFIPLGNGTLFIGIVKGLEELLHSGMINEMPKLTVVQSEHCQPFVKAREKHLAEAEPVKLAPTLAEGIAIGAPMRSAEILEYMYKYEIDDVIAPEDKILQARGMLAKQGIYCEHTTAAIYAAYEHYTELHEEEGDVLISMCGAGLKSDHS